MPDSKTDPGRLLDCGLSWMEAWRTRRSRSTRTYTWPDDEPNQTRWIRFSTRWAWVGCSSSRPRYYRCNRQAWMWAGDSADSVDDTVVVDLHVIGISMNGEAVLVSDTEDICCKKGRNTTVRAPSLEVRRIHLWIIQTSDRCSVRIVSYLGCKRRSIRVHFHQCRRIRSVAGRGWYGQHSQTRHSCRASRVESASLDLRRARHQTWLWEAPIQSSGSFDTPTGVQAKDHWSEGWA